MKMLIAFQKNSQNREATQAGGGAEGRGGLGWVGSGSGTGKESRTLRFSDRYTGFFLFVFL